MLDLSECEFIDSSGIAALVAAHEAAAQNGGGPRGPAIVVTEGQVARVLKLMGLERTFALFASRDEALAAPEAGRQE